MAQIARVSSVTSNGRPVKGTKYIPLGRRVSGDSAWIAVDSIVISLTIAPASLRDYSQQRWNVLPEGAALI